MLPQGDGGPDVGRLEGCLFKLFSCVVLIWLVSKAAFYAIDTRFYRQALPEEVGVGLLLGSGSDLSWPALLLPIRHEACGGAAFRLSAETADALKRDGLDHLHSAQIGRGYRASDRERYYTYEAWQETPLPASWTSDGSWPGLHCMGWIWGTDQYEIIQAAKQPGGFFSKTQEGWIVIIPSLNLVVYSYFG